MNTTGSNVTEPKEKYPSLPSIAIDTQDIALRIYEARVSLRNSIATLIGIPTADQGPQASVNVAAPKLLTLEMLVVANSDARSALCDLERDLAILREILL